MPLERVSRGFKDISLTLQRDPLTRDLITLQNEYAIARSVQNLVLTVQGEKFLNLILDVLSIDSCLRTLTSSLQRV